ncbi:MAG: heavy metal translocating P-type ATPase, partial [Coriobacteriales bacterium]
GDDVYGGTTNTSGSFAMRVTRIGDDMTLANIIRMVDDATNSKAPIERTADRSCSFLVFAIIVGAAVVCFLWGHFGGAVNTGIVCGASLLVTASVSALGLSTPTAIMISIEKAALNGILMKSSEALEKAKQLEVIVFEKTGILTTGRPSITEIIPSAGITREELLGFAASLEEQATHPLGRAICEYADQSECPSFLVTDFEENPGAGVAGTVAGRRCLGGNKRLMKANGVDVTDYLFVVRRLCDHGRTPLFFTAGGKVLGIIALADSPRKNSARAIAELKSRGVKTVMLTGDNRRTAEFIQRRVGTSRVIAEVAPADREGKIRELGRGVTIAMVGDRTADAASLARADLGIAIGTGNDTDMGAANVMLIHDNLLGIPALVQLGCATMATIRRDIVWAIVYNVVLIPIACGAFVPLGFVLDPLVGACAMSLFSLLLVYRALRLREWAPSFHAPENMHPSIPPRVRRAVNTDSLVNFDTTEFDRVSETGAFRPVPSETDAVAGVRPLPRDVLTDDRGAFVVPDPSSSGTLRPTLVLTNTSGDAVERPSTLPDQTLMFRTLVIEDMTSDADVELVTSALEQVDGVAAVRVNLPRHKLIVELERPLSRRLLVKVVASVGFSAVSKDMDAADIKREQRTENRRERRELRREQREEQREKVVDIDEQRTQNRALMESLEGEGGQPQDAEGVSGKGRKTRQERRTRHHAGRVTDRAVETDAQGSARQTEQPAGRRRHARGAHAATPSSAGTVRQHARRASLERMTERLDQHEQQRRRHLANVEERRRRYERADGSGLDETDVQAGRQPRPEAATDRPGGDGVASGTSATSASQPRYPYPSDPNWYINDDDQLLDDDSDIDTSPDRI